MKILQKSYTYIHNAYIFTKQDGNIADANDRVCAVYTARRLNYI